MRNWPIPHIPLINRKKQKVEKSVAKEVAVMALASTKQFTANVNLRPILKIVIRSVSTECSKYPGLITWGRLTYFNVIISITSQKSPSKMFQFWSALSVQTLQRISKKNGFIRLIFRKMAVGNGQESQSISINLKKQNKNKTSNFHDVFMYGYKTWEGIEQPRRSSKRQRKCNLHVSDVAK